MKYKYVSPTLAFCNQMLLLVLAGLCYYTYTHSCQLAKNYDKQIFSLIINKLDVILRFAAVTLMIQVYIIHIVCGKKTSS